MRLRHIEVFHAVYTTGSITNAAKLLYVSQPSVSKVLAHAELQLGFQLFQRSRGRLIPTPEAEILFTEVDKIYQQIRSIRKMSENIQKSEYGHINVALTPALGFDVVPKALAAFRQKKPKIHFNLQTLHNEEALQALMEHKCDIALLYSSPPMPGVAEINFAESELVILYPKSSFPHLPLTLNASDLAEQELIGIWDSGPLGELAWNHFSQQNIDVTSTLQVETYYVAARLVAQGLGCCIIDKYTAQAHLSDDVAMASFEQPMKFPVKGLYLDNNPLSKTSEVFLEYIQLALQP